MNKASIIIALALVASAIIVNANEFGEGRGEGRGEHRGNNGFRRGGEGGFRGRGRGGGRGGLENKLAVKEAVKNKIIEHEVGDLVADAEHKRGEGILGNHLGGHEVFEGPIIHRGPGLGALSNYEDGLLIEELRRRGHHGLLRHGGLEEGLGHQGLRRGAIRRPILPGAGRTGPIGLGGAGAIGGAAGALGGFDNVEAGIGGVGAFNHNNIRNSIQGGKSGSLGNSNHLEVDHHSGSHDDIETGTKHQIIDQDQVIVKNKINAINDSKGFRQSRGNNEDDHFETGSNQRIKGEEHGRIGSEVENDTGFGAAGAGLSHTAGAGAVGLAGGAAGIGGAGAL